MAQSQILVVEDEAVTGMYMRFILEHAGYSVTAVEMSGEDAVVSAAGNQPDLALIDINLAGEMDGIEVARILRESKGIPSLFMTAYLPEEVMEKYPGLQARDIITKPIEETRLRDRIEGVLNAESQDS